jgi:hypothetical protein
MTELSSDDVLMWSDLVENAARAMFAQHYAPELWEYAECKEKFREDARQALKAAYLRFARILATRDKFLVGKNLWREFTSTLRSEAE